MRRTAPLVLLPLFWCLIAGSPAEAAPINNLEFLILPDRPSLSNPGILSYAGGTAPFVGSNLDVFRITQDQSGGSQNDSFCVQCTLNFSTGPFAGTIPAGVGPAGLEGYSFSGGGSLQIIGGVSGGSFSFSLPTDTLLLSGVTTGGSVAENIFGGTESFVGFRGQLNPELASLYQFPAGASHAGDIRINTAEVGSAPNAFTLTTIESLEGGDQSSVGIQAIQAVPLPATLWPFAIGFVAFAVWRGRRKAVPL